MLRAPTTLRLALGSLCLLTSVFALGCGAKTGLYAPDVGTDVVDVTDVTDVRDVPILIDVQLPMNRCFPIRVHTRVGFVTVLQPDADFIAPSGYTWTMRTRPPGSDPVRAPLGVSMTNVNTFTADVIGEFDILVTVPTPRGPLDCPILLVADPVDPMCPGYALTEPRKVDIPMMLGDMQVGYDIVWRQPRVTSAGSAGAILSDDTEARVATAVFERDAMAGSPNPCTAAQCDTILQTEGEAVETQIEMELNTTGLLVGRASVTHEGFRLRRSTLRFSTPGATDTGQLRDRVLRRLTGLNPPPDAPPFAPAQEFYVEVATLFRHDTRKVFVGFAISPVVAFEDMTSATAIRVNDFANATSFARRGSGLEVRCHSVVATRTLQADFLWLVDTSGSMDDDQERVGETADRFFRDLNAAGVDFHVGVFQAGHAMPNLATGGYGANSGATRRAFQWITNMTPNGAQQMAFEVTDERFHANSMDTQQPFRMTGGEEEPVAAAVEVIKEFERQALMPMPNPNFVLRPTAAKAVFFVTDESGMENDYGRYFRPMAGLWGGAGAGADVVIPSIVRFFTSRAFTPFGLVPNFAGSPCPSLPNLPQCVITQGGGAFTQINITNAAEANRQVSAAIARVVDVVAGQASEFILPAIPISSSLRARINNRLAPRSRSDGFDYEERSRALVFRGPMFRARMGDQVRAAYFIWTPPP